MSKDWNDDLGVDVNDLNQEPHVKPSPEEIRADMKARAEEDRLYLQKKLAEMEALDDATKAKVMAGEIKCPICEDDSPYGGSIFYEEWHERLQYTYGYARNCWCRNAKRWRMTLNEYVPKGYHHMDGDLKICEKSEASLSFQQKVIDLLIAHPDKSFAFFGPTGVGKTALSMWLLIRALHDNNSPMRASSSKLVRQHHAYITDDTGDVKEPDITVQRIENTKRPLVWLAELEKIGPMTEYKYEVLFGIIDTLYEKRPNCQFVMDSNLQPGDFEEYFTDKINRRVSELCYVVNYFDETISRPTEESMR